MGGTIGNYRIVDRLGEGGMGAVYLAEHRLIGRLAAIKVLHGDLIGREEQVSRFFNEAKSTSSIRHPGILEVYDFGWHDGSAFIVMEYLEGESLEARLQRLGTVEPMTALRLIRQVAGALAAAHDAGIIHRDLKPDNVVIIEDAEVAGGERTKLLDFGIAKIVGDHSKTQAGTLIGTPDYMAPEQCRGTGDVDYRADLYALGCILFRMLTGQLPFVGEGIGEVISAHIHQAPPDPRELVPDIEPALAGFILRLLEKEPSRRPTSAWEVIAGIDALFPTAAPTTAADPLLQRPMGKQRQTTGGPSTISSAAMAFTHPPADEPSSMRWVAIAAAAMVTSTGVGYGYLTMQSDVLTPRPASALTEQVPAQASEPEPAAAPDPISITIRSKPEGAEVFRASDGLRVGMTPYKYTLDPVDGELIYTLKLDDYQPETVTFSARDGGVRLLTLRPVIAVPAAPPVDANEPKESEQRAPMKTKAARRTRTPKNPIEKPTSREQSRIADDAVFNPFE